MTDDTLLQGYQVTVKNVIKRKYGPSFAQIEKKALAETIKTLQAELDNWGRKPNDSVKIDLWEHIPPVVTYETWNFDPEQE